MITVDLLLKQHQDAEEQMIKDGIDRCVAQKMIIEESRMKENEEISDQLKKRHYLARKRYEQSHYAQVG